MRKQQLGTRRASYPPPPTPAARLAEAQTPQRSPALRALGGGKDSSAASLYIHRGRGGRPWPGGRGSPCGPAFGPSEGKECQDPSEHAPLAASPKPSLGRVAALPLRLREASDHLSLEWPQRLPEITPKPPPFPDSRPTGTAPAARCPSLRFPSPRCSQPAERVEKEAAGRGPGRAGPSPLPPCCHGEPVGTQKRPAVREGEREPGSRVRLPCLSPGSAPHRVRDLERVTLFNSPEPPPPSL